MSDHIGDAKKMIIKPLKFTGNHHQIEVAEAMGFKFYVQPPGNQRGWRWAVFDPSQTIYSWMPCKSKEDGKALCNAAWRLRLEPFLEGIKTNETEAGEKDLEPTVPNPAHHP